VKVQSSFFSKRIPFFFGEKPSFMERVSTGPLLLFRKNPPFPFRKKRNDFLFLKREKTEE